MVTIDRSLNWEEVSQTPGAAPVFARLEFVLGTIGVLFQVDWRQVGLEYAPDEQRLALARLYTEVGHDLTRLGLAPLERELYNPQGYGFLRFQYRAYIFTDYLRVVYQWSDYEKEWTVYADWF